MDALQAEVMRGWVAPRCAVDELVLISRAAQDAPFLVHWRVPLGGGAARREAPPLQRGVWLPTRPPAPVRAATTLTATATATATAAAECGESTGGAYAEADADAEPDAHVAAAPLDYRPLLPQPQA